ncbi:DUF3977 family protein [Candidatus Pacearchaeota archaeon]|nr:DUF3977 family protein [Candidatus Pacearchaeota archaeon]
MKKIYAEAGYGNKTFLSTEIEEGKREYRIPRFIIPKKIESFYIRIWIFKKVYVFSTKNGFEINKKSKNKFKVIFGIAGY